MVFPCSPAERGILRLQTEIEPSLEETALVTSARQWLQFKPDVVSICTGMKCVNQGEIFSLMGAFLKLYLITRITGNPAGYLFFVITTTVLSDCNMC